MKILLQLFVLIYSNFACAQIYKCTDSSGQVFYQDNPCPMTKKSETVKITHFDPEKIAKAKQKLAEDLERRALKEQLLEEKRLKEREVSAIERNANATESIAEANWYQSEMNQQRYNYQTDGYFYFPLLKKPHYKNDKPTNLPAKPMPPVESVISDPIKKVSPRNVMKR